MKKLFNLINSRLWMRVLIPVFFFLILVMGVTLWHSISSQDTFGREQLTTQNEILARAVEGGMFDALAIGDNDTVRTQFKRLNDKAKDLKVYVYDFNGLISFATDASSVGKRVKDLIGDGAGTDLLKMLKKGKAVNRSMDITLEGTNYILKNDPILNEKKCAHCHGNKRKVLGGISVLSPMASMQEKISKARDTSILIALAGLCLVIFLIWSLFTFLVNRKVARVIDATSHLRKKDFTHNYEVKPGDEINHILNRINLVTQELRGTIHYIAAESDTLLDVSNNITDISDALNYSSNETSQRAIAVSSAAEEMSTTNSAIATTMDDASARLSSLASAVDELSATVSEISKNASGSKTIIDLMVQSFETILMAVKSLGSQADNVDEVTDKIRSISEQVSLLALNAKIEAARAGEAGKGFAVVAQEITELAVETQQSTSEADDKLVRIKSTVSDLTEKITGLADSVRDSDDIISSIAVSVEEQNVATLEIAKNINEVSSKIFDVNQSVTQGVDVATSIAKDISAVEEMSGQVKTKINNLNQGGSDLAQISEKLKHMMSQFKI